MSSPIASRSPAQPSLRFESVDWLEPRAAALRAAMEAEMSALYAGVVSALSDAERAAADGALGVHPESFVATVLGLERDVPVAHAALRRYDDALEVKRVFVAAAHRGRGHSRALMLELERIGRSLGAPALVLQTGRLQTASIALYRAVGYREIEPFGGYAALPLSVCFRKEL